MIMVGCVLYNNDNIDLILSTVDWRSKLSRLINNVKPVCLSPFNSTPPKYLEAPLQVPLPLYRSPLKIFHYLLFRIICHMNEALSLHYFDYIGMRNNTCLKKMCNLLYHRICYFSNILTMCIMSVRPGILYTWCCDFFFEQNRLALMIQCHLICHPCIVFQSDNLLYRDKIIYPYCIESTLFALTSKDHELWLLYGVWVLSLLFI